MLLSLWSLSLGANVSFQTLSPYGGLGYDGIKSIRQDSVGFMWVVMKEDIFRYDGYEYRSYANRIKTTNNTSPTFFRGFKEDTSGIVLLTSSGEYVYKYSVDSFICTSPIATTSPKSNSTYFQGALLRASLTDNIGVEWYGTQNGLYMRNPQTKEISLFKRDDGSGLVNNSIWTLYNDYDNNLWVGTYSGGVCFLPSYSGHPFSTFRLEELGLPQCAVSSMVQNGNSLWLGTEGAGVIELTKNGDSWKVVHAYMHDETNPSSLAYNNVNSLLLQNNRLWIGMYMGGLDCLNLETRRLEHYKAEDANSRISSNHITKLIAAGDSGMWIIYPRSKEQLSYYSWKTDTSLHINIPFEEIGYENQYFVDAVAGNSCLYMATGFNVYSIDGACSEIRKLISVSGPITSLYYDKEEDQLWIGTHKHGVFRLDIQSGTIGTYSSLLKYDNITIYSIVKDGRAFWMGTDRGILRFIPYSDQSIIFDASDNLQSPVFFPRAAFTSTNGLIYFGGNEGFSSFRASDVVLNSKGPKILLSEHPKTNKVSFDDNTVSFTMSCTNFYKASKNRFRYRLRGVTSWTEVDSKHRTITFSHLRIGNYCFEACAANNDGVWGDVEKYEFRVCPTWWNGWWAWVIYALIIGLLISYFILTSRRHRKLQNELYQAQVREQEQEKAGRAKVRFFTDVSKELKTPLLSLQAMVDVSQVPYVQEMLNIMDKYADRYCIDVGRDYNKQQTEQNLDKLTRLIDERMTRHIDIDLLAREMGMSRRKLFDFVKNNTGKSIIEYIRSYRLSTAAKLLFETNMTVLEVMDKVGIESQSYFVKSFKKEFGDTPADFVAKMSKKG